MKHLIVLLTIAISSYAQIYISEIERNPPGAETEIPGGKSHEYIELLNCGTDTFQISEISLYDGSIHDQLIPKSGGTLLKPGSILLILDPDYFPIASQSPIPYKPGTIIATINHTSLCGGLAGSDGFILDRNGKTIATMYDSTTEDGKYQFSTFSGTENEYSSISRSNILLENSWSEQPASPGSVTGLTGTLYREYSISETQLIFAHRSFGRSGTITVRTNDEVAISESIQSAVKIDTIQLPEELESLTISGTNGTDTFTDTVDLSRIRLTAGAVQISEISPRSEVEWVELHNQTNKCIDLSGWKIYNDNDTVTISTGTIAPDQYLLFSKSEIFPTIQSTLLPLFSFDNYRDTLRLDSHLGVMDSVCWDYTKLPKWTSESLQRTSVANGFGEKSVLPGTPTPGGPTSLSPDNTPFSVRVKPELFTPDGDGKDDELQILVTSPAGFTCTIRIFSTNGMELRRFDEVKSKIAWNGGTDSGLAARRGPLVVVAEFSDESGKRSMQRTGAVLWR